MPELRKRQGIPSTAPITTKSPTQKSKHKEHPTNATSADNGVMGNILKIILFVVAVPPMLNYASLRQERDHLLRNATLYDVGFGQKMFMSCLGEGSPTLILESPTGASSDTWLLGQSELSLVTKTCVYDRAGLGWSDPAPRLNMSDPGEAAVGRTLGPEATVVRMAHDLHRLITFAYPQERPLILVGSELGALVTRVYTQLHSQDVAHLVMIDPLSETLFDDINNVNDVERSEENPWLGYWYGHVLTSWRLLQVSAMTGLSRLALVTGLMVTPGNDVSVKHHLCDPFHVQAVIDEHRNVNTSLGQVRELSAAWSLADSGVESTVISGSVYDQHLPAPLNRVWSRGVQDVIGVTGSRHLVISEADRNSLLSSQVTEVVAPILRIIKAWRQKHLT